MCSPRIPTAAGSPATETAKLTGSDSAAGDRFGISVAVDQNTVVVGAYGDNYSSTADTGSVYVFTKNPNNAWRRQTKLNNPNRATNDWFGYSVAVDGNTVVVGAYGTDHNNSSSSGGGGADTGSVYITDIPNWTDIPESNTATTTHTVTDLTSSGQYTFQVRAVNIAGEGPPSSSVTATVITLTAVQTGADRVRLVWDPGSSPLTVTGYQHTQDRGATWTDIPGSDQNTVSHIISGLTQGAGYTFGVRTLNNTNTGAGGASYFQTVNIVAPPAAPTGLTATTTNTQATLNWNNPDNPSISHYQYQQAENNDGEYGAWTEITGSDATTTTHIVPELTNDTAYAFRIRAVNIAGAGPASDSASATPVFARPAQPTGITAETGDTQVTLSWDDPADSSVTGYEYQQAEGNGEYGNDWTEISGSDATTTTHTVTELTNDTAYVFRVRAVNTAGADPASDSANATPALATPAQPTGVGATGGDAHATLSWDDPDDSSISGYEYQQTEGGGEYGAWTEISGSDAATVMYTVSGLTNDTAYAFRVRAVNSAGAGPASDSASATPALATPAQPTGVTATGGDAHATLSWDDPDNSSMSGYEYQQAEGGGEYGAWTEISGSDAATTMYTVSGLSNDTSYAFRVRAVNIAGAGPASDDASATPVLARPAQPTGITAETGDTQVTLSWDDPADSSVTGYEYQQAEGNGEYGNDWTEISGSDATTTTHTVTELTNDTAYVFRVRAVNTAGAGPPSESANATPALATPAQPTGVGATGGDAHATLSWDDPDDSSMSGYEYQQTEGGGEYGAWTEISGSDAATVMYTVSGLTNDTAYAFRVRAVNSAGAGPASDDASATPALATPAQPTGITAEAGDTQATLRWDDPDNPSITGYEYQQAEDNDGDYGAWTEISGSDATTTTHTVTSLTNDTSYAFRVRAVNSAGAGPASDDASATPVLATPAQPTGITAEAGDTQVTLSWDDPDNSSVTGYEYQQAEGNGEYGNDWTEISGSDATTTTHTVTELTNDTAYVFRVRAVNTAGAGPPSESANATPALATPAQPTGVGATGGDAHATLSWDDPDDSSMSGYEYQQAEGGGEYGAWTEISGSDAATVMYTVSGLSNDTAYAFRVRAVSSAGAGPASDSANATPVLGTPAQPTGLTAEAGDTQATLRWDDPDNPSITGYEYQQAEDNDGDYGAWTEVLGSDAATTTHTVTELTNDTAYAFRVRAVNIADAGPASDDASATPVLGTPAQPTGLTAEVGDTQATLRWDHPDDLSISGYEYQQAEDNDTFGQWTEALGSDATTTAHTVTELTNEMAYNFRVRAVNIAGAGSPSDDASATPVLARPAQPTGLTATTGDTQVTLSWNNPDDPSISGYEYQQTEDNREYGNAWTEISGSDAATTMYTVSGLSNDTAYVFRVRAVNIAGAGSPSDDASATPVLAKPAEPPGITAETGDTQVTLTLG